MKMLLPSTRRRQNEKGVVAVLIVLILVGIMLIFIASNTRNLNQLKNEIDLIEQKHLQRQRAGTGGARVGSTGDSPVPSGHWPDGTSVMPPLELDALRNGRTASVPSGGSPLGTGQWPVLPIIAAKIGFNQP